MPPDIGANGFLGVAKEVTMGTWVTPAKFIPILSENLKWVQDTYFERSIRKMADINAAVPGNGHVEGTITFVCRPEVLSWFQYGMRGTVTKTGAGPFVYALKPTHEGGTGSGDTLSFTVVRNGVTFGYVGCAVSKLELSTDDGILMGSVDVVGFDEATQTLPTYASTDLAPLGSGSYDIEIPDATDDTTVDSFTFTVDDSAEAVNRLRASRGAAFIKWGERQVTLQLEKDFLSRTEYDAFKALTAQGIQLRAANSASHYVEIIVGAAIKDDYEIGLSGQGDLIMASITYQMIYNTGTTEAYHLDTGHAETIA